MGSGTPEELGEGGPKRRLPNRLLFSLEMVAKLAAAGVVFVVAVIDNNGVTIRTWDCVTKLHQPQPNHLVVWTGNGQPEHFTVPANCAVVLQ